jgi:3-phenylpropionate/cinnamic acid dioxygenase small subunit
MAGALYRGRPLLDGWETQSLSQVEQSHRDARPDRYAVEDSTEDVELAILDENKHTLSARVARLDTGMAWAEDAPSRTRHLLANIEVETGSAGSELNVRANFIVYRSRSETEQDFYVGPRRDVLRLVDGARGRSPTAN